MHEDEFPHSSVGSFWKYDAGSEQLKAFQYFKRSSHIDSIVFSIASIIFSLKLSQSPVEKSFSYTWQVLGHSSKEMLVVSLHGGFVIKHNMCRKNSRQAGGDSALCARSFTIII